MIQLAIAGYTVSVAERMPECDDAGCAHAALIERFGNDTGRKPEGELHIEVRRESAWAFLCVAQQYSPGRWAGCYPGILLVAETDILFIGAGERLLAYDVQAPARLWEEHTCAGFHAWQRHDDVVVMSGELELAAWDMRGVKLWSTKQSTVSIEPPWDYHVEGGMVYLDVMGTVSSFPLVTGPASH